MSVKSEIIDNLINDIKIAVPDFKYVKRGLVSLEDLDFKIPLCSVNSIRQTVNRENPAYGRLDFDLQLYIDVYHKNSSDYYKYLDEFEEKLITLFKDYSICKRALHDNVIKVEIDEISEILNDEYLNDIIYIRFIITVTYTIFMEV